MREPNIIHVPAQAIAFVDAPEMLHESNPTYSGGEADVLVLRVGQGLAFIALVPAVRVLLDRCIAGSRDPAELFRSVPASDLPMAKRLVELFSENGLTTFDMSAPASQQDFAAMERQSALKHVS